MFSKKRSRDNNVEYDDNLNESESKVKAEEEQEDESSEEELGYQELPSLKSRMKKALKTKSLDICATYLTGELFKNEVVPFLESHPEVIGLDASGEFVVSREICEYLSKNINIKYLKMRLSRITPTMTELLAENQSINNLDICDNHIGDQGAIALALKKNLKELSVFNNHITQIGTEALVKNTSLVSLGVGSSITNNDEFKALLIENNTLRFLSIDTKDPELIKSFEEISKKRVERYDKQFTTFLMGGHPKAGAGSPILHSFFKNRLYDKKILREVSDFLKPPATLKIS